MLEENVNGRYVSNSLLTESIYHGTQINAVRVSGDGSYIEEYIEYCVPDRSILFSAAHSLSRKARYAACPKISCTHLLLEILNTSVPEPCP